MPELLHDYDALVDAVGGGDLEARFLSHWCPPPLVAACSIADLLPRAQRCSSATTTTRRPCATHWPCARTGTARSVIGMTDCGWGADGRHERARPVDRDLLRGPSRRRATASASVWSCATCSSSRPTSTRPSRCCTASRSRCPTTSRSSTRRAWRDRLRRPRPRRHVVSGALTAANRQGADEWPEHAEYCTTVRARGATGRSLVTFPLIEVSRPRQPFLRPPLTAPRREHLGDRLHRAYDAVRSR